MPPSDFTIVRAATREHPSAVTERSVEYPVGIGSLNMFTKIPELLGLPPIVSSPSKVDSGDKH